MFAAGILENLRWAIAVSPQDIATSKRFGGTVYAGYDRSIVEHNYQSALRRCVQGNALLLLKTDQINLGLIRLELGLLQKSGTVGLS